MLLDTPPALWAVTVTVAVFITPSHTLHARQQALNGDERHIRDSGRLVKAMSKIREENN